MTLPRWTGIAAAAIFAISTGGAGAATARHDPLAAMMSGAVVQGNFAGLLGYSHYAWTFHEDGTVDASYTLAASRTASRTARTKTATDMGTWWVAGNNSLCVNFRKTFAGAPACFHVVAVSAKGVRRIRLTGAVEIEGTLQPAR